MWNKSIIIICYFQLLTVNLNKLNLQFSPISQMTEFFLIYRTRATHRNREYFLPSSFPFCVLPKLSCHSERQVTHRVLSAIPTPAIKCFNESLLASRDGEISVGPFARVIHSRRAVSDTSCSTVVAGNIYHGRAIPHFHARRFATELSALFQINRPGQRLFLSK